MKKFANNYYWLKTHIKEKLDNNFFQEIAFVREIQTFCMGKEDGGYLYQVMILSFRLPESDNSSRVLIKKIASVFNRLEVLVSNENRIIKALNISSIRKRWEKVQVELLLKNQGSIIENYCYDMSNLLADEKQLVSYLNSYKMFGMIFNGITTSNVFFEFDQDQLLEGSVEEIEGNSQIKYTIVWKGSRTMKPLL